MYSMQLNMFTKGLLVLPFTDFFCYDEKQFSRE